MSDEKQPPGYLVGYGKPPIEGRLQKGKSGNPSGRPRRKKTSALGHGPSLAPTRDIIWQEAHRPVTLRDGDKIVTMSSMQAVMRSMTMQAIKETGSLNEL